MISTYDLSLLQLTTVLQARRSVYDLLANPGWCTRRGWPVDLLIESGGQRQAFDSNVACSR